MAAWPTRSPARPAGTTAVSSQRGAPAPASARSTAPTPPARSHYTSWRGWPDAAGRSRSPSRPGKELAGLDEHQVRRWTSWHLWTVLGDARARLPRRHCRHRTRPSGTAGGAYPADPKRDPTPVHRPAHPPGPRRHPPAALVAMATPPPSRRARQPLPPPRPPTRMITIYGWSTSDPGSLG